MPQFLFSVLRHKFLGTRLEEREKEEGGDERIGKKEKEMDRYESSLGGKEKKRREERREEKKRERTVGRKIGKRICADQQAAYGSLHVLSHE